MENFLTFQSFTIMKLYINPEYEHLRDDISNAISGNYVASKVFCHKRNIVEKFSMQGKEYVIKIYKKPNLCNRIAYSYFRKPKAERAYRNAVHLLELGIDTPKPVAYAMEKNKGLFSTGYFISEYLPYHLIHDAYSEMNDCEKEKLAKDFMDFTHEMHSKQVLPLDFNSSNIFYHYDEKTGHYCFALTDINRMRFGKTPTTSEVMRSFEQLGIQVEWIYKPALYYCTKEGSDVEYSIFVFLFYRIRNRIRRVFKRKVKEKLEQRGSRYLL